MTIKSLKFKKLNLRETDIIILSFVLIPDGNYRAFETLGNFGVGLPWQVDNPQATTFIQAVICDQISHKIDH